MKHFLKSLITTFSYLCIANGSISTTSIFPILICIVLYAIYSNINCRSELSPIMISLASGLFLVITLLPNVFREIVGGSLSVLAGVLKLSVSFIGIYMFFDTLSSYVSFKK